MAKLYTEKIDTNKYTNHFLAHSLTFIACGMDFGAKFFHAFYPEKNQFLSSEIPHRAHIIFLTWRLSLIPQKPFLRNYHLVIKTHLPLLLEYEVKRILDQNRSHIIASFTGKISLKCSHKKQQQHHHFRKFCSSNSFTLL